MIWFLLKGILRDRHRSLFPIIIVSLGVALTVLLYTWFMGVMSDMLDVSARFDTGHVKVVTPAYWEIESQVPNDLGLFKISKLQADIAARYSEYSWSPRIRYGGILDIPDENGETRSQGPVMGLGLDLLSPGSKEVERLKIATSIVRGRMPAMAGEILITEEFARGLGVNIGETATLISATAAGGMAIQNFVVVGTVQFGLQNLDRGTMIADIRDIQYALDMEDACSELLGFRNDMVFDEADVQRIKDDFNSHWQNPVDKYAPMMLALTDQRGLGEYYAYVKSFAFIMVFIFIFAMSIVLWNTSLMSGIRRYGEIGVRLAIGESKGEIYKRMLLESVMIGIIGSVIGTAIGLLFAYYLQEVGLDISSMMRGSTMMIQSVVRAKLTPTSYYIGFIPGVIATTIGTAFAGIGVFKRQTATLFKELET